MTIKILPNSGLALEQDRPGKQSDYCVFQPNSTVVIAKGRRRNGASAF
jgi:hypothetical protein